MAAGDAEALGALYDAYGSIAYGLAYAITGAHASAESAVAAAFAEAWRTAATFDTSRLSVLAWVTSLVRQAALAAVPRERRRTDQWVAVVPAPTASTSVGRALGTLTEPQRRVLELSYFRGLSASEIAAHLGERERDVRELLKSAMNDLRSAVSPTGTVEERPVTRA